MPELTSTREIFAASDPSPAATGEPNGQLIASGPFVQVLESLSAISEPRGVTAFVPAVLAMTQRVYPSRMIRCRIDCDPESYEIEDHFILFDVDISDMTPDQLAETQRLWCQELGQCCPSHLAGAFRLGWKVFDGRA